MFSTRLERTFIGWGTLRTFLQQTTLSITELLKQQRVAWKTSQSLFFYLLSFCICEFSLLQELGQEEINF